MAFLIGDDDGRVLVLVRKLVLARFRVFSSIPGQSGALKFDFVIRELGSLVFTCGVSIFCFRGFKYRDVCAGTVTRLFTGNDSGNRRTTAGDVESVDFI